VLESLGAGPLEDLLNHHGESVIKKVIEYSKENDSFKSVISYVWKNKINNNIWESLSSLKAI